MLLLRLRPACQQHPQHHAPSVPRCPRRIAAQAQAPRHAAWDVEVAVSDFDVIGLSRKLDASIREVAAVLDAVLDKPYDGNDLVALGNRQDLISALQFAKVKLKAADMLLTEF